MKNLILLSLMFLFPILSIAADQPGYAVTLIPAELKKNANAVVRHEQDEVEIVNLGRTRWSNRIVVTILNEAGEGYCSKVLDYDKFRKITRFEGAIYDAMGNRIRTLKKSEIGDMSGTDEGTLADDARRKHFAFHYKDYPFTVEFDTEVVFDGTYLLPNWVPQSDNHSSVEYSSMTVRTPSNYELRFKSYNNAPAPVITNVGKERILKFEMKNLRAYTYENYAPHPLEIIPFVFFSPTEFEMMGYRGDLSSWSSLGKFNLELNKGRDVLPESVKSEVHKLTDNLNDPYQKIDVLYKYMQSHTRYVSIQLGIGGLQPFPAEFVAKNKYGDCKALTNYMYALLKEAGVRSCYTLVKSGKGQKFLDPLFPKDYFDHIILGVPLKNDTVWLECTNQFQQTGFLGDFTEDRYVLMIDDNGGKLVRTPAYKMKDNTLTRLVKGAVSTTGELAITSETVYRGLQQQGYHALMHQASKAEQEEYLKKGIDLPTFNLISFSYIDEPSRLPAVKERLNLKVDNYAQVSGKRLFITPNILSRSDLKLTFDTARKFDVVLGTEYIDIDTVELEIPDGYVLESEPKFPSIDTKFAKYSSKAILNGNRITYIRTMEKRSGRFPPETYAEMVRFYEQVYKADRAKMVLVKKDS